MNKMTQIPSYPKRLIEVDLPIKKISEHARREKSIRHGHISTLHLWWARRPLAACRAILCASLWPDPADPLCPQLFIESAKIEMNKFWNTLDINHRNTQDLESLRSCLLDFIVDFSNWDHTIDEKYIKIAHNLTNSSHISMGGISSTRPLVVDPFAGGGAIPLEALRIGADIYASDLNPISVLINKAILEYIPKYGEKLPELVMELGQRVQKEAEKELSQYYPKEPDGSSPIAYLWARTIICEGPGCGATVPMIKDCWLGKKPKNSWSIVLVPDKSKKIVDIQIIHGENVNLKKPGTVNKGTVTCPICGYTTPNLSVKKQISRNKGGTNNSVLYCVVTLNPNQSGRVYRKPNEKDLSAIKSASITLNKIILSSNFNISLIPDESYPDESGSGALSSSVLYGFTQWGDIFTQRQKLALITIRSKINKIIEEFPLEDKGLSIAIKTILAFNLDKVSDYGSSLSSWSSPASQETVRSTFSRQALPMIWDYAEAYPFINSSGGWLHNLKFTISPLEAESKVIKNVGITSLASATNHPLPDDSASAIITDPPYYDAIAYGDLSSFFYVWLKRILKTDYPDLFSNNDVDTSEEIVSLYKRFKGKYPHKTKKYYESEMEKAFSEARRILDPKGICVVVFAHKSTAGWEAQLNALIKSGWVITGSWPIDTERPGRTNAIESAALASSIHLVCRPRENPNGSIRIDIGDYQTVLSELPGRIHEWMKRLVAENVVGADAIFACLGPALEIFSRYSSVEKPSGEVVSLREYLEQVWAAISREALTTIFSDADTSSFEPDARLTAMWLWTLTAGSEPVEEGEKIIKSTGYELEFDTARKIAQGLGANLEELDNLVEIKGSSARLLPVMERADTLFGKGGVKAAKGKKKEQMTLGDVFGEDISPDPVLDLKEYTTGKTMLDLVHQSMILHAAGKGELLKAFLIENGKNPKFWTLAQAFAALYPTGTDERRWIEAVMARKKTLGL